MLSLPTRNGWGVSWYTGETKTISYGGKKIIRVRKSYESKSKEKVEAKAKEIKENGFEIDEIYECFF